MESALNVETEDDVVRKLWALAREQLDAFGPLAKSYGGKAAGDEHDEIEGGMK